MNFRQFVFVDDSGDPGLKLGKGSSRFFVIAAVLFFNESSVEKASNKILHLKQVMGWSLKHEFKYRKTSIEVRRKFFNTVRGIDCHVSIYVVDKDTDDDILGLTAKELYNETILNALRLFDGKLKRVHLYIDGEAGNNYRSNVKTFFRKRSDWFVIDKLSYRDSNGEVLIQMADMIAGAARAAAQGDKNATEIMKLIKKRVSNWKFS